MPRVKGKGVPAAFDHPRKAAVPAGERAAFDELRAQLGATKTQLRDGVLHALDAGYEVEP